MPAPRKHLPGTALDDSGEPRDTYDLLTEWPQRGVEIGDCAARCSMSPGTLREILGRPRRDGTPRTKPRDQRASDAWQVGHGRRKTWLWSQLHDPSVKNKSPAIYELKSKYGYTDMPKPEPPALESIVKIGQLILPGPVSREEWARLPAPQTVEAEVVEEVTRA